MTIHQFFISIEPVQGRTFLASIPYDTFEKARTAAVDIYNSNRAQVRTVGIRKDLKLLAVYDGWWSNTNAGLREMGEEATKEFSK
jgi:hypothetical protein